MDNSRDIELIRLSVNMPSPCCACKKRLGTLTCAGCNAVKFCSKECRQLLQKYGSPDHEHFCNKIKKCRKETEDAIEALAEDFGGIHVLLGLFEYQEEFFGDVKAKGKQAAYISARWRLTQAYADCGQDAGQDRSCTAFRLAAENMLDLLCLGFYNGDVEDDDEDDLEEERYTYCGWMVAAGMDQEALNFLCYFQHRQINPLPFLDLSEDENIEGDLYLDLLKYPKSEFDWSTERWFHDFMLIALIKYKRLQYLMVQKQKCMAAWKTFLMGTHPRAGMASTIQQLEGNYPAIKKIHDYVMKKEIDFRIDQLNTQIKEVLTAVNKKNPFIIPGIIDKKKNLKKYGINIDNPCWACIYYGHTWNMSPSYTQALQKFLDTGHILSRDKCWRLESNPVEEILQAASEVDPTLLDGLWNSNPEHALAVFVCLEWRHFLTTMKLEPQVDVLKYYQNLLNSHIGDVSAAAFSAIRLVSGKDRTAADIPGNFCNVVIKEPAVTSPQDQSPNNVESSAMRAEVSNPPEKSILGAERSTLGAEITTNPPERFTLRAENSTYSPDEWESI